MPRANPIHKLIGAWTPGDLQVLLTERYPRFPAQVTSVSLPAAPPPKSNQRASTTMYKASFANNESKTHSNLKWIGLRWCAGPSFHDLKKYRFEVRIAYPDQLEFALSIPGKGEIVGEGVPLPKGHRYLLNDCVQKVADVFGCEQIVECGQTDPSSLVLPLAARVARRVLWLHYPRNEWNWGEPHTAFDGLLIERKSQVPSTVKSTHHYPLRVLKSAEHTFLIGRRDCDAELLPHGGLQISYA